MSQHFNTGKAATRDPRMAPGKAPDIPVDSTHKPMPEYPLDPAELIYPGDGNVPVHDPPDPFDAAEDPLRQAAREACTLCAEACERLLAAPASEGLHDLRTVARACADTCLFTRDLLRHRDGAMPGFTTSMAALCSRLCRACAEACGARPEADGSATCVAAAEVCARACDALASPA